LIGQAPLVKRSIQLNNNDDYVQLQESRCRYLSQWAGGRTIPEEIESRADFYPADPTHIFADILNNMEIIDHLDQNKYPYLFQALKSLGMRKHLNGILYNMYSHGLITEINKTKMWFLQGVSYLRGWNREQGVTGSPYSWQSHVIFMTDTGLLKKYVDNSNPTRQMVYRSVPLYTDNVLHTADQKAKDYIDAGINLNRFTKDEVIKVSGQERADWLYYGDSRITSHMKSEVDELFINSANRLFTERRYLLPDEIEPLVIEELNNMFWIDPLDKNPDPNKMNAHDKAFKKLNQLKYRYEELSKEIPCQYRELTPEEKVTLQLPPRSRKKYFIKS